MSVSSTEVKRCFVLSDKVKGLAGLNRSEFGQCLNRIKPVVVGMGQSELNLLLGQRAGDYDRRDWSFGGISIDESQIFVGAGELPPQLCLGSVRQVAGRVAAGLQLIPDCRAKFAIPGIITAAPVITSEKLLSVIALPAGDRGPSQSSNMRWHIDDGCMRSIALAISGKEKISAYIGTRFVRP